MRMATERAALVTGGASGIGLETARRLVADRLRVALLDLPGDRLDAAAAELTAAARAHEPSAAPVVAVAADVRRPAAVAAAVGDAIDALGGLDTLVVCAGVIHIKPLADVSEDDWDRTLDVNLKGAFLCCQAAAPALTASGRGRIVMISSDAGRRGVPLLHAYSASKFGLVGLTQSLAGELAPHVTVNAICPVSTPGTEMGRQVMAFKTAATERSEQEVLDDIARQFPLARAGTEADVADAVRFFVSDAASFVTGVALDVDGGAGLNAMPGAQA
ncbi:SDR family NAD(P)-dependent oxidoreductase [Conexibacter arvalis]|uniref:NAD(P)-dependent dehydrogenase (Short-subunit alcohol dehydrogenase family) n=1 Tax=Conexibacter arvalis TaxID=912552 RepID=A0A840I8B7_9ACTN|nr:SDR family NAD(P)-dependent oxidoreductase [Conexibacter arvalis]MBB4660493.1 NAD(P)-dependent dehydrogenase (short-subunit alcohol dehydrogenase family) [Conexibacter arvalis]